MTTKIALIKMGSFSYTNNHVADVLNREFPDMQLEVIDIRDLVNSRALRNVLYAFKEYGGEMLGGKSAFRERLLRTTYLFKQIKRKIAQRVMSDEYAFSFQTQSLFDASVPGLPHFVYTDHTNLENLRYPYAQDRELYSRQWINLERLIYHNATLNFTMSTNISRSIVQDYACEPDKARCIYAGSNIEPSAALEPQPERYAGKHIVFVGVAWERKGGPELIQAFKQVLAVHPDARLTVVGCTPTVALPNCFVVGKVPLSEVGTYYNNASIFCLPTRREPFGIAFIEAAQHKLPVIGTNIGAIPDLVRDGETGYLVEPGNVPQLTHVLLRLLENPDLCRAFGEQGYHAAMQTYTWQKTGIRMREHIERALGLTGQTKCQESEAVAIEYGA